MKVLDFGLAKALDPDERRRSGDAMQSPTLTARATQMGVILGTAAYMAPEQAKGRAVDKRADIWAFGVVLYEMLTGRRAFDGDDISTTMAAVLMREPDTDRACRRRRRRACAALIARCLVKDPKQRLRDIGDARLMLDDEAEEQGADGRRRAGRHTRPFPARLLAPTRSCSSLSPAAIAAVVRSRVTQDRGRLRTCRSCCRQGAGDDGAGDFTGRQDDRLCGRPHEGNVAAVPARDRFVRGSRDRLEQRAQGPFFSPDGRSVAFFAGGKLWRAAVAGGAPTAIATASRPGAAPGARDGTIVYVPR